MIGDRFRISFTDCKDSFDVRIIGLNLDDPDRKYRMEQTNYVRLDAVGRPYTRPDSIIEVEELWFTANPKRIVKPILI